MDNPEASLPRKRTREKTSTSFLASVKKHLQTKVMPQLASIFGSSHSCENDSDSSDGGHPGETSSDEEIQAKRPRHDPSLKNENINLYADEGDESNVTPTYHQPSTSRSRQSVIVDADKPSASKLPMAVNGNAFGGYRRRSLTATKYAETDSTTKLNTESTNDNGFEKSIERQKVRPSLLGSPFYQGQTSFGGRSNLHSLIRPMTRKSVGSEDSSKTLSTSVKQILAQLENQSSILREARRIPPLNRTNSLTRNSRLSSTLGNEDLSSTSSFNKTQMLNLSTSIPLMSLKRRRNQSAALSPAPAGTSHAHDKSEHPEKKTKLDINQNTTLDSSDPKIVPQHGFVPASTFRFGQPTPLTDYISSYSNRSVSHASAASTTASVAAGVVTSSATASKATDQEWKCEDCWVKNAVTKEKCVCCGSKRKDNDATAQNESLTAVSSSSVSKDQSKETVAQNTYSATKPAPVATLTTEQEWKCGECWVQNPIKQEKCVCCGSKRSAEKPSAQNTSSTAEQAPATTLPKLNEQEWQCDDCWVKNSIKQEKCVCCGSKRRVVNNTVAQNKSATAEPALAATAPKTSESTWQCDDCWVKNSIAQEKCVCCGSKRSVGKTDTNKSQGAPVTVQSKTGSATSTTAPALDDKFANIVRKQKDMWQCSSCLSYNENDHLRCQCCDMERENPSKKVVKPFAFPKASNTTFKFGIDPQLQAENINKKKAELSAPENKTPEFGSITQIQKTSSNTFTENSESKESKSTAQLFNMPGNVSKTADSVQPANAPPQPANGIPNFGFSSPWKPITEKSLDSNKATSNSVSAPAMAAVVPAAAVTTASPFSSSFTASPIPATVPTVTFTATHAPVTVSAPSSTAAPAPTPAPATTSTVVPASVPVTAPSTTASAPVVAPALAAVTTSVSFPSFAASSPPDPVSASATTNAVTTSAPSTPAASQTLSPFGTSATGSDAKPSAGTPFGLNSPRSVDTKPASFGQPSPFESGAQSLRSMFSSPATTQPYIFGGATPSQPAFGSTAPSQSNVFGASTQNTTSAFGAKSPSTSSAFGATTQSAPASFGQAPAFGASSQSQTNTFGSGLKLDFGMGSQTQGSAFGASGSNQNQSTLLSQPPAFGTATQSQPSAFGAASQSQPPAFGASSQSQSPAFGATTQNQSPAFGATTQNQPSAFGSAIQNQPSAFGTATQSQPSAFGAATQSQPSAFGAATQSQPSAFGAANQSQPPAFGTASQNPPPPFGAATQNQPPAFGTATQSQPSAFGAASQNQSTAFGAAAQSQPPAFGAASQSQPSAFGSTSQSQPPAFGAAAQSQPPAFGAAAQTQPPAFGAAAQSQPPAFGTATPNQSAFGVSMFGSPSFGASQTPAFAAPQQQMTPAFNFGAASSSTPVFGFGQTGASPGAPFSFGQSLEPSLGGAQFTVGSAPPAAPRRIRKAVRRTQR